MKIRQYKEDTTNEINVLKRKCHFDEISSPSPAQPVVEIRQNNTVSRFVVKKHHGMTNYVP